MVIGLDEGPSPEALHSQSGDLPPVPAGLAGARCPHTRCAAYQSPTHLIVVGTSLPHVNGYCGTAGTSAAHKDHYSLTVSNAAGYLCHIHLEARYDCSPETLFAVLSNPGTLARPRLAGCCAAVASDAGSSGVAHADASLSLCRRQHARVQGHQARVQPQGAGAGPIRQEGDRGALRGACLLARRKAGQPRVRGLRRAGKPELCRRRRWSRWGRAGSCGAARSLPRC